MNNLGGVTQELKATLIKSSEFRPTKHVKIPNQQKCSKRPHRSLIMMPRDFPNFSANLSDLKNHKINIQKPRPSPKDGSIYVCSVCN